MSFLFKLTKWLVEVGIYLLCLQIWHECPSTHVTFYLKYSYFDTMSVCLQTLSFSGRFLSEGVFPFYMVASILATVKSDTQVFFVVIWQCNSSWYALLLLWLTCKQMLLVRTCSNTEVSSLSFFDVFRIHFHLCLFNCHVRWIIL